MAFNNKFIILCIINISLFINTINAVISSPHILTSVYEDIVEKNGNYTLLCQGTKPLKWTFPKVDRKHAAEFPTKITIEKEKPNNPLYKYGLRLYITNMTFPYVGFYTCHNQNGDNETNNIDKNNNRVYLFIDDPEKLAVFYDDDSHKLENVHVIQNHVAVIPCRPTSPEVKVSLSSDSLIIKPNILTRENTIYQYSPFYGFSTNDTMEIGPVWYDCLFVRDLGNHTVLHKTHYMVLLVETHTSYIPTPILTDENYGHTTVGGDIQLKCKLPTARSEVIFAWDVPSGNFDSTRMNQTDLEEDVEVSSILTITNVTFEDNGTYVCKVSDYQDHNESKNISIKIFDIGENYIKMREVTDNYYFEAKSGQESVIFSVQVWGHPQSNFTWLNNNNETIKEGKGKKYEVKTSKGLITLKIRNIDLSNDFGYYSLVGRNDYLEKTLTFFLNVTDKPTVTIHIENFYLVGEVGKVQCTAAAHPIPELKWEYKNCLKPDCFFREIPGDIINEEGLTVSSEVTLNVTETGVVKCTATNSLGTESEKKEYHVTDVVDGFGITGFENNVVIKNETKQAIFAVTERIIASCRASTLKYKNLTWLLNDTKVQEDERHSLIYGQTDYSYEVQIKILDIDYADTGIYSCRTFNHLDEPLFKNMSFLITDSIPVKIIESNMVDEMIEDFPKPVSFRCMVEGIPKPNILWYKNDKIFEPNDKRIHFDYGNQILVFTETEINDQGEYKCKAYYKDSSDFRKIHLKFRNAPAAMGTWLIYIIIFLILLLAIVVIYLFLRVRKEKRLKREMKLLGLANFEKGAVENINPELGIDDQAELLPYDRKWEFPIEQLKLGKQLGSGAFGVVLKGEAKNIIEGEPVTTVAVKMVKKNADNTYIKALASELKIMVHLGKHLNVVNLLGACTKNVAKRELLVIVEYCRFGNLQNFLLRHRDHFIDQIDPNTGKVNYNIGQEELLDRTYSMSSNRSATHSPLLKYAALVFSDSANNSHVPSANAMGDYRTQPEGAGTTETTTITQGDDHIILSNNSIQPEWRSNYKGDYKGTVSPISTKDLIAWSFQIARGMEYLASRKVLHGDLAARNILLTEDNIVKICDFGLAKSMYKSDNYKKRGDCPLPVKWMAIESIRDRVFSTQSDVWSFGIVLWEIFSLGRTPYPGMEADERLYYKLVDGYRLESPDYAPNDLYKIMTECWSAKPTFRPTFTKLTEKIGTLLEDTLRKHYIDLNDPYLAMNTRMLENQNDYLAMLCPPTFEAVSTPNYVNDIVVTDPQGSIDSGYMSMKPNNIFSPRLEDDEIFDFSVSNRKNDEDADNVPELLPMLTMKEELDKENCPKVNSVSNPSYHLPPIIDDRNTEIVVSNHNYVNMPQNKHLLKDNKTNLNIDNKKNEVHYVNDNVQDWDSIKV